MQESSKEYKIMPQHGNSPTYPTLEVLFFHVPAYTSGKVRKLTGEVRESCVESTVVFRLNPNMPGTLCPVSERPDISRDQCCLNAWGECFLSRCCSAGNSGDTAWMW